MSTKTYRVAGMTCEHCVRSVSTEVGKVEGVTGVDVQLDTGLVTVTAATEPADDAVRAAVEEAGYEVVS